MNGKFRSTLETKTKHSLERINQNLDTKRSLACINGKFRSGSLKREKNPKSCEPKYLQFNIIW